MQRRNFLQTSGLLAAGFFASRLPLMAGPFTDNDFHQSYFPADKKLDPDWVKSLYERGEATSYRKTKNELRYIGMPVGGICCGTVYVGGDGRLWVWDIFNANQAGAVNKILPIPLEGFDRKDIDNTCGTLYLEPAENDGSLQQGFALHIRQNAKNAKEKKGQGGKAAQGSGEEAGKKMEHGAQQGQAEGEIVKRLHQDDWDEVVFEATYPIATVRYIDKSLALEVTLHAFSPFIPGDAHRSGLPATVQSITLKNLSAHAMDVTVTGWLENKMLLHTAEKETDFKRVNRVFENEAGRGVALEIETGKKELERAPDFGNMSLMALGKNASAFGYAGEKRAGAAVSGVKDFLRKPAESRGPAKPTGAGSQQGSGSQQESLKFPVGVVATVHHLEAGAEQTADFIISWYTPNVSLDNGPGKSSNMADADYHYYTAQFGHSSSVAEWMGRNYKTLKEESFLWKDTWYDSTLPWWFLERTLLNISTLATTTSHRFRDGRFYAWEGVGCCQGTCMHVYQYAQAMSRIFPELERGLREKVDLGVAFDPGSGMMGYRGEGTGPSIDGQAGTVLRIYREYLMSGDGRLLRDHWDKIKKTVEFVIRQDKNGDGMEDTPLENTLDARWSGEISWIVGLCLAAVKAGQAMAEEMKDPAFADICRRYVDKGMANMEQALFNGEYFIHRPDPAVGKSEIGSYNTCHIDQVYGQAWAWQAGLGRVLSKEKTMSALRALWKYNYMPDVGPYIKQHKGGRFYALAGDGGMIMNTNPSNEDHPYGNAKAWQIGYFSECMSGFEHQVAAHMMAEGMVEEALVLTKSIHDRYHAFKRNPFNEIECSDHYGRAMASYGTFISASGFMYHGPKGYIGFAPKLSAANCKMPFTVAEGWGSYSQQRDGHAFSAELKLAYGRLGLTKITVELEAGMKAGVAKVVLGKRDLPCTIRQEGVVCEIELPGEVVLEKNELLTLKIG